MRDDGAGPGPLAGVRIVDLSRVLAGPYCAMLLADLGADVIKIEEPTRGDETRTWGPPFVAGESAYFLAINRNKRSVALDLRDESARQLLFRMLRGADVAIENFKLGTMERWGLGYERLHVANPRLVYGRISGYGPDGPYADRPGYDLIAEGMGGIMSVTGEPDGEPMKVGVAIADVTTGLYLCSAILAALHARETSGVGQRVDVSLLESVVGWLVNLGSNYLAAGSRPRRLGNAHPSIVPYQVFRARDRHFTLAVGNDGQFAALCEIVGEPSLAADARFATNEARVANRDELIGLLSERFAQRDAAYWVGALLARGVPSGPINEIPDVFADPQVLHRRMVEEVEHPTIGKLKLAGIPFKLSETPATVRRAPPLLGQHTDEVLAELGLGRDEIDRLRTRGAIR
ncbi:MAG TPA: CaiB/BaiF CoA-transferase family protein [Chloroflexota bacterium]|nr:CaiB/BaiF CoA-transferase family protein [Chloroflexota bacterium]